MKPLRSASGAAPVGRINTALIRDLERRLGTDDIEEWLEREAQRVAALGRMDYGAVEFSAALRRDRNINRIQAKPHLPALQTIQPTEAGYRIHFSPYQESKDQRFGIAHEIAHTFWFAPGGEGRPLSPLQRAIGDDPTIEWLCNHAAAAILLPREDVRSTCEALPMVLHEIPAIADRYVVPEKMVARRLFHDLSRTDIDILMIRVEENRGTGNDGRVAWFALAPRTRPTVKEIRSRVLPGGMLPDVPSNTTSEVELDGRWWLLVDSAFRRARAKPLGTEEPQPTRAAWTSRVGSNWYVALPSQE